ncbi:MAG TPA: response regulator transcription factor [Planctomycetota bacterium]|nr:response regulator transcription factor [Planctomycetota bacterium]
MKVLVVDDDSDLRPLLAYALRNAGYLALEAGSGEAGLELLAAERPDLVILDVALPGIDGLEVCRRLRAGGDRTPVLMLTVRSEEEAQVAGLDAGADDYLAKPFSPRTLLARVRALLRRAGPELEGRLAIGPLSLDEQLFALRVAGQPPIRLSRLEFRCLQLLVAAAGRPVPTERILRHVWGERDYADREHLKQLVHRLRQKLEADPARPEWLLTEPGVGYRLGVEPPRGGP